MKLIPTKKQWKGWTLPSKLTAIGTLLSAIALLPAAKPVCNSQDWRNTCPGKNGNCATTYK